MLSVIFWYICVVFLMLLRLIVGISKREQRNNTEMEFARMVR